jgi:hypothetical protein
VAGEREGRGEEAAEEEEEESAGAPPEAAAAAGAEEEESPVIAEGSGVRSDGVGEEAGEEEEDVEGAGEDDELVEDCEEGEGAAASLLPPFKLSFSVRSVCFSPSIFLSSSPSHSSFLILSNVNMSTS